MSEALNRILPYALAFSEGVDRCRTATAFKAADWQDAYNRLSRMRDRYIHERSNLDPSELQALIKVFEEDTFIQGLLNIRQIGEHVQMRKEPVIRLMTNAPFPLVAETSAGSVFAGPVVTLQGPKGQVNPTDHLQNLTEAESRIQRAFTRATNATNKMP